MPMTSVMGNPARFYKNMGMDGRFLERECLGMPCKSLGGDNCDLNTEAIVECAWMRGDIVLTLDWYDEPLERLE